MSNKDKNANQENSPRPADASPFVVVGIGASAGGLQALEEFFEYIPDRIAAAFVVIQHLSPSFKSLMKELLERRTVLPVYRIETDMAVESGAVYVMPEKLHVRIVKGKFVLSEADVNQPNYPIDLLFESLAREYKNQGMGVLLSGTGSDGTEGLRAISQAGGMAMIQSPETAEFSAMGEHALPTGLVDEILSPRDLAQTISEIVRIARNMPLLQGQDANIEPLQLNKIIRVLEVQEDIDFSQYKTGTLSRRIYHRCSLTGHSSLQDYIQYLETADDERKLLIQDLLIGSTRFFRDPEAWKFIEAQILPLSIANLEPEQELRIWVAGCATGEEAYTMAMLVDEAIASSQKFLTSKIFATDIDTAAVEFASKGVYSASITQDISPRRLKQYFAQTADGFAVKPQLREKLIFAPHNLIKNAGFSKMNLISCRNVLIYMQTDLQLQVLRMLHFSLGARGILFLGGAEILGNLEPEFTTIHPKWKIYQKRRDIPLSLLPITRQPISLPALSRPRFKPSQPRLESVLEDVFHFCFGDRPATCLLLDADHNLLHTFHDGAKLLKFPMGEPNLDVTAIFPLPLQLPLTTALHRAKREKRPVLYTGIKIHQNDLVRNINLKVTLLQRETKQEPLLVVLLEEETPLQPPVPAQEFELDTATIQQIKELQYDLQQTRENLQVTIEELEATNEEQQAANEEQIAANEELQSTNEELHSVNEELYTVNAEYQSKIQALTELNNDIDNLLQSTEIGVVFLDRDLKIRKFTPAVTKAINLISSDLQRPLAHLSCNFDYPQLAEALARVLTTQETVNQEITIRETGDRLLMRIHPYWSNQNRCDGLVLTLIDINEIRQAQTHLEYLYTSSPVGLCLTDEKMRFVRVNQVLAEMNGLPVAEHIGKTVRQVVPELADRLEPLYRQVMANGKPIDNQEIRGTTAAQPDVERFWMVSLYALDLPEGLRLYGTAMSEITPLKQAQEQLRQKSAQLQLVADALPAWISYVDRSERYQFNNATCEAWFGRSPGEIQGLSMAEAIGEEIYAQIQGYVQAVLGGNSVKFDIEWPIADSGSRWVQVNFVPHRLDDGRVEGFFTLIDDISDRKAIEKIKDEFISTISHELRTPLTAIQGSLKLLSNRVVEPGSDKGQRLLKMAAQNTQRLVSFINDVLDLERLQSFRSHLHKQTVQAAELMNQALPAVQSIADAAEVAIDMLPQDIEFYADGDRLIRVMVNLLNNAIKFSPKGSSVNFAVEQIEPTQNHLANEHLADEAAGENPCIYVEHPLVLFKVQDYGRGIPDDKITTIFDSFYQVDSSDSRQKGGSGLGLAISRKIVEQHGGKIWVESQPDAGSTFSFTIPLIQAEQEEKEK